MKIFFTFLINLTILINLINAQVQWEKQNSPVTDHLHDVFFLNDSLGWAYSYGTGIIIHTSNGGKTWQVQARLDSLYFEQIQFLDKNNGWLCGERGHVFRTTDGGTTWIDVSPSIPDRIIQSYDYRSEEKPKGWDVLLYAMHFFNSEEGFIAGGKYQPSEKNGWQKMQYIFLTTEDGGKSWIQNEQAPDAFLYNTSFINDTVGYASGTGKIFQTKNQGKTWQIVYNDTSAKKSQIRGLYFLNSQIGFGVTFNGKVIKTTDGARSWDEIKITKNRLRSIVFVDDKNGFIVGDKNKEAGVLYRTKSSGNTWQKVDIDYPDLHRIKLSPTKIWIVGKEGTILMKEKIK